MWGIPVFALPPMYSDTHELTVVSEEQSNNSHCMRFV